MEPVYLQRSDGALCKWEGMSQDDVLNMLTAQGFTATIMTEEDYNAAVAAAQ